jgi:hypothetical protein
MSFINILLKGNLIDILYQTSAAIIVSHITQKTLYVSINNINEEIQPILKYIKKSSKMNCQNSLDEKNITSDNISLYIPKVKKNLELIGDFKNRNYFKEYKSILIDHYNLETEKDYSTSTYVYIDSNFENKKDNYVALIDKITNNVEIVIDSKEYDNIKMDLDKIYAGNEKISIVENVDYKKLCVMAKCGKGGYYTGEDLGWWGSFLNKNESIEIKENEDLNIDISIVMVYNDNLKEQTINTLNRFQELYASKYNFEVIIVDNNSLYDNRLDNFVKELSYPVKYRYITKEEKGKNINSCLAYNIGFKMASGHIIMIQNPECYHARDILDNTMKNIDIQTYLTYCCFTTDSLETSKEMIHNNSNLTTDFFNKINSNFNNCGAILKDNLKLIGGFDELLSEDHFFEKEDFLLTVQYVLQLNIKYNSIDDGFLIEQFYNKDYINNTDTKNKKLYDEKKAYFETSKFNFPRILHLYWDGSPLSFLNICTIYSFNEYHKYWKINLYIPNKKNEIITWTGNEQKRRYNKKCYLDKTYSISNVIVHTVDLKKIGFDKNASDVINSDFFRYYILSKHGGIWSDFDIIYTDSVEKKMNFNNSTIIFHCTGVESRGDIFKYYPIGFFMSKPNSLFFKYILKCVNTYYDPKHYQCIGATMFNSLFKKYDDVYAIDKDVKILDNTYYLPFQCNELEKFIKKENNILPVNNVGIHWFNGGEISKQYSIDLEDRINNFSINCYLDKFVVKYIKQKNIALFSESSYPGGGGEEFLQDIAIYFYNKNYNVFWFTLHDWGKRKHKNFNVISKKYYTEIQNNREINQLSNYDYFLQLFKDYNINYILHQGAGHKLICDIGNRLNIPTITFWCFWEEALNINWSYGLLNITENLDKHNKSEDFNYIIDNIDHYYFASSFVKNTIESKYNIQISNDHVFPTLTNNKRSRKDHKINSFNSKYISLLDAHTLKGGLLFSKLILLNPDLLFLAIKTEDEDAGPDSINSANIAINNTSNILHYNRINDIKDIYNQTKILLCPTLLDETFCRTVYEAFANRIPVIFSNNGNLKNIDDPNLLKICDNDVNAYHTKINELINDEEYYNKIVEYQYEYYLKIKELSDISIIEKKLLEIETNKNKNIGIFTPWCDQGLGIQSRIYKKVLTDLGYNVFIFSSKPYITDLKHTDEWDTDLIYRSPNKRLDVNNLEWDLFIENYKIKKLIIPEIQFDKIFEIANYLKEKHNIKTYAIPNIECIRDYELERFNVFEKILVNNKMSYNILSNKIKNVEYLGFSYDLVDTIKINTINKSKKVNDEIHILHLSGLNGLFRKRTDVIVRVFDKIYNSGIQNFKLNIVIQGNFDKSVIDVYSKPFINITFENLLYSEILNKYNENHISLQFSKHEGLGLGFYESCYMNTPVITLNAAPHNEIIHHEKNGWLLSCYLEKDKKLENPYTIIEQTQIIEEQIIEEISKILLNTDKINEVIHNTKQYTEVLHNCEIFKKNFIKNIENKNELDTKLENNLKVFSSGSCRLLTMLQDGKNKIQPIHSIILTYSGINFLGKLHNTKQHIQFIKFIKDEIILPDDILSKFLTSYSNKSECEDISLIPVKKRNLKCEFDNCEWYLFEICSLKLYKNNGYEVHFELTKDYETVVQTEEDFLEDLKLLRTMIPYNKKILFQTHFRPNIIYNDDKKQIENRDIIFNAVNKFCKTNYNTFIYDPSILIKEDHSLINGDNHFLWKGYMKSFEYVYNNFIKK